jgi:hypothetical protein
MFDKPTKIKKLFILCIQKHTIISLALIFVRFSRPMGGSFRGSGSSFQGPGSFFLCLSSFSLAIGQSIFLMCLMMLDAFFTFAVAFAFLPDTGALFRTTDQHFLTSYRDRLINYFKVHYNP